MSEVRRTTSPPAPDAALRLLEAKLGACLPPVLRQCYATSNGGIFRDPRKRDCEWQLHPVFDGSDRKQIKRTAEDILYYNKLALQNGRFPSNGISIAHDYTMLRQLFVQRDEATNSISEQIFLFDAYKNQWCSPYATDLRAAIQQVRIPEAVQPDQDRALPEFRYHADPLQSGVISASSEVCECCGKATGYIYSGSFYAVGDESRFCPWCIADGSAARKFKGQFNDDASVGLGEVELPDAVVTEVSKRTPSFFSFQQEQWWAHCNDAGRFLGEIEHVDRVLLASDAALEFRQIIQSQLSAQADWQWLLNTPSGKRSMGVYVFRCLHCGRLGGYSDCI